MSKNHVALVVEVAGAAVLIAGVLLIAFAVAMQVGD